MTDRSEGDDGHPHSDLPLVGPPESTGCADEVTVPGLVLAGGTSRRYGQANKLLATHEGKPIVRHAVNTLVAARTAPVVVVLGHEAARVEATLEDLPVQTVRNESYTEGQASSVRSGLEWVQQRVPDADGVIVSLGDMPAVSPTTVDTLVDSFAAGLGDALAPAYEGRRGNPVCFDRRFFDSLRTLEGDTGGRRLLLSDERSVLIDVSDPGVRQDIDRPADNP